MRQWISNVGSNAVGRSVQNVVSSVDQAMNSGAAAVRAAVHSEAGSRSSSPRQPTHLRLPVESANRLRWFESKSIDDLVRQHTAEKLSLMHCVQAMRVCMVKHGVQESTVDEEMQKLLAASDRIREADDGVYAALLVSAQDELTHLRERLRQTQQDLEQAEASLAHAPTDTAPGAAIALAPRASQTPKPQLRSSAAAPAVLLGLACDPSKPSAPVSVQLEVKEAAAEPGAAVDARVAPSDNAATAAAVRLADRYRSTCEDLIRVSTKSNSSAATPSADGCGDVAGDVGGDRVASAASGDAKQHAELQARWQREFGELVGAIQRRPSLPCAPSARDDRESSAAAQQAAQLATQVSQLRNKLIAAQTMAAEERDRCHRAQERAHESGVRCDRLQQEKAAVELRLRQVEKQLSSRDKESPGAAAPKPPQRRSSDPSQPAANMHAELMERLQTAERRERQLEHELQASEARLSAAAMQLEALEDSAAEHDELTVRLAAVEARAEEAAADARQNAHFRERSEQLQQQVDQLSNELVSAAQAARSIEARASTADGAVLDALAAQRTAEQRLAELTARIDEEVRIKLQTVMLDGGARWPPAAERRVKELESQAALANSSVASLQQEVRRLQRMNDMMRTQHEEWKERAATADQTEAEARVTTAALEKQLRHLQAELERVGEHSKRQNHRTGASVGGINGSRVRTILSPRSSGSLPQNGSSEGSVLKDTVLKTIRSIALGRIEERDALLPMLGMLIGATPDECISLKALFPAVSKSMWG